MMRCRMRSIASGVVVHVPNNGISIQQCIQLAAILRRQCITRTQRSEDLLERFTRLTVCGGEIFTQMPEQQLQRLFIAPNLMQLQRQLRRQCGIFWILRHLLLQLLNFRLISRLLQQFDLRYQPLVAASALFGPSSR